MGAACGSEAENSADEASGDSDAGAISSAASNDGGTSPADSSTAALANADNHAAKSATDCVWDTADAIPITLRGTSASAASAAVTIDGSTVRIGAKGTYLVSGSLSDGQIVVDSPDTGVVKLVLQNARVASGSSAAVLISDADRVAIIAEGTNTLADGTTRAAVSADDEEPSAALFSMADLTLCGTGVLAVQGNYRDGVASKDGLVMASGQISVTAADDALRGKDYVVVTGGTLSATASGDGIVSDNATDASKGYVSIEGGTLTVKSGGDAIAATTDVLVSAGDLLLTAGGGVANAASIALSGVSAKGIKGLVRVVIDGGSYNIDAADDAIHTSGDVVLSGGVGTVTTGDDAVHAETSLTIEAGDLTVAKAYEGLESASIAIRGGSTYLVTSDDGVNGSTGSDGTEGMFGPQQATASASGATATVVISGGRLVVDAAGDGLDSNGSMTISGGTIIVNGPTGSANAAIDGGNFSITGGFLVSVHTEQMADEISGTSAQNVLKASLGTVQPAGTLIHLQSSAGAGLLTFAPAKSFRALVFSAPDFVAGSYALYIGGTATGSEQDGLYEAAQYTPGTLFGDLTVSSALTTLGTSAAGMMGGSRNAF
jgi:hypothetical protein